jgi:hypothetical protein
MRVAECGDGGGGGAAGTRVPRAVECGCRPVTEVGPTSERARRRHRGCSVTKCADSRGGGTAGALAYFLFFHEKEGMINY